MMLKIVMVKAIKDGLSRSISLKGKLFTVTNNFGMHRCAQSRDFAFGFICSHLAGANYILKRASVKITQSPLFYYTQLFKYFKA
jgi:hypothetical protein